MPFDGFVDVETGSFSPFVIIFVPCSYIGARKNLSLVSFAMRFAKKPRPTGSKLRRAFHITTDRPSIFGTIHDPKPMNPDFSIG